ncbi:hypothetical protein [Flavisolibacter tropicus]|uniref:TonB-dependent receptor plug domain-containing protein n=1 Tax=Flavisolibacter tropicus TaxID=1492898 RepID=A0A172TXS3_9BACT|nr:hypothetical protein [Flavisolibacter tropicus]ANE51573.1 hypothetical protein SY85_14735 [Flavisolibacter tropicus]
MKNLLLIVFLLISTMAGFSQAKPPTPSSLESPLFRSIEGTYFDLEHDNSMLSANSYFNILDWLQGRVAGLQVYTIRGIRVPYIRNYPATIYVDEIRSDASILNMLPVADMALVKIIKSPQAGIGTGPGGAIVVYTKRGEEEKEE